MSGTHATVDVDDTITGKVILVVTSSLAAVLVIAALIYAPGMGARHQAALAAAGCEPSLYVSSLPCITQQMLVTQYEGILTPASKLLNADITAYTVNEGRHIVAAEAALNAEVAAEQDFDNNLAAVTDTPQNSANSLALITNAASNSNPVPSAAVMFTPQITVIADALIQADQALAKVTAEQARSATLTKMRSFNHRVQAANAAVQAELKLMAKALDMPPQN
jgi:hypothetical protein